MPRGGPGRGTPPSEPGAERRARPERRAVAFVFQRDLRVDDNRGFALAAQSAARSGARLVPAFLMDDRQLDPSLNPYRSAACVALMAECLADLGESLEAAGWGRLVLADARAAPALFASLGVAEYHHNRDFTPFAARRDAELADALSAAGALPAPRPPAEYTLWEPGAVATASGEAYRVYGPFARAARALPPPREPEPPPSPPAGGAPPQVPDPDPGSPAQAALLDAVRAARADPARRGHRERALRTLREVAAGAFDGYPRDRDDFRAPPGSRGATGLSLAMKFGAVSCREVHRAFGAVPALLSELLWREYYAHLAAGHPRVLAGQLAPARGHLLNRHENAGRDRALDGWRHGPAERRKLAAWARGATGEPLVDAAMRSLAATGRLHNRLRMVAASHLVKEMGVDWRRGERVFASLLADYDPASNGGGWRAMDAQAPGRHIRAAAQARKHDPSGAFAARWLGPRASPGGAGREKARP